MCSARTQVSGYPGVLTSPSDDIRAPPSDDRSRGHVFVQVGRLGICKPYSRRSTAAPLRRRPADHSRAPVGRVFPPFNGGLHGDRPTITVEMDDEVQAGPGTALTLACPIPSERVAAHGHVTVSAKVPDLSDCRVLLSTAHKWATVSVDATWPWAIVDEAYQMRSDLLLRVAGRFDRALFAGDPGHG